MARIHLAATKSNARNDAEWVQMVLPMAFVLWECVNAIMVLVGKIVPTCALKDAAAMVNAKNQAATINRIIASVKHRGQVPRVTKPLIAI